jgi:DNA-binding beta-propeller fold protein YncE
MWVSHPFPIVRQSLRPYARSMPRWFIKGIFVLIGLGILSVRSQAQLIATNSFVNFETAPVHPISLSPDGKILAVANLPAARVELFSTESASLSKIGSVPVGLDPVTVRFRTTNELWVVNALSDSISIIKLPLLSVAITLNTVDAPADVVFAGQRERAFVSGMSSNSIQVIDVDTRQQIQRISIDGDRPRALAVSPDKFRVYVAIFESGNSSTILGGDFTGLNSLPPATVVDFPQGPHKGQNPPPNSGSTFVPPINPNLPATNAPPRVSLIVKKNSAGRWLDDNHGDWTEYVSGTNSFFTGRVEGWDISDNDLAEINASSLAVKYSRNLMNICSGIAVNPASRRITLVGTDASNEIRFEPVLKGVFVKSIYASVSLDLTNKFVKDLNPHLDYKTDSLPPARKKRTIGDPRCILWNQAGTIAYVAGNGSDNILLIDPDGAPLEPKPSIAVDSGPAGLELDETKNRLYVFHRFANSVWVIDTARLEKIDAVALYDPTPEIVKKGRKHFYNTQETSGLGQAACASCHVDSRFDRLAWDLGNPLGNMERVDATNRNFSRFPPTERHDYHPMKGPMVTQSLQDIIGHEPFHWRGDKEGIEQFNGTFTNLQAASSSLTTNELAELKGFLSTIHFPPNPFRTLSNTLPPSITLASIFPTGLRDRPTNQTLIGFPANGLARFRLAGQDGCIHCHSLPTGLGPFMTFQTNLWRNITNGANGERHVALIGVRRSDFLPFKIPSLRNLFDKVGLSYQNKISRSGFGFSHDGSVDTLPRFLQDSLQLATDQQTADVISFLFCLTGSDLPQGLLSDPDRPIGLEGQDVHAAVGRQFTMTIPVFPQDWVNLITMARSPTSRVDLICKGFKDGLPRGWVFNRSSLNFRADRRGESQSPQQIEALASQAQPMTLTVVPRGTGVRLGIDADEDGFEDRTELDSGSDPFDPASIPLLMVQTIFNGTDLAFSWTAASGKRYQIEFKENLETSAWNQLPEVITATSNLLTKSVPIPSGQKSRYYRITSRP